MMEKAEEILKVKGVNPTAVRILVLRSSIFRSLKTFEEKKVVHSIEDGSGMIKYAVCPTGCNCDPQDLHYHFYCTKCGYTYCLLDNPIPIIKLPQNFKMQRANMVVKGLCNKCS